MVIVKNDKNAAECVNTQFKDALYMQIFPSDLYVLKLGVYLHVSI